MFLTEFLITLKKKIAAKQNSDFPSSHSLLFNSQAQWKSPTAHQWALRIQTFQRLVTEEGCKQSCKLQFFQSANLPLTNTSILMKLLLDLGLWAQKLACICHNKYGKTDEPVSVTGLFWTCLSSRIPLKMFLVCLTDYVAICTTLVSCKCKDAEVFLAQITRHTWSNSACERQLLSSQ